ncbi:hypothetical protein CPB97_010696 [Podila verticillata]|nr:hypothetical protein CPB97_010696 [Podila verticillata]
MHITHVPKECIQHILRFLDPPDHHSLLLTCRVLFLKVVPGLYRSPFQAILAFDGWHIDSRKPSSPPSPSYPREATSISTSVVSPRRNPSMLTSSTTTTSSLSSSPSTSPSTSPSLSSSSTSFHNSVHTPTNIPPKVDVPHVKIQYTPHNVNIASSYNNNSNSNNIDIPPRRSSTFHHRSYSESHTIPHSISTTTINPADDIPHCANNASPLDRLKWSKMARLLQLLIACTDVQARLPALRYPGYGQQWIRPPCKVDYLRHYIDHHNFAALVLCFPYLFADKSSSCELLSTSPCTVPQDSDVFKVLFQIQRAFMAHTACRIQTLSVSARSMAGLVVPMIPQLSRVTRLELTDLDQDFELEPILDFVKSHRMLVGPILKDIKLAGRSFTSRDTLVSTYTKNSRLNADKVRTILGAIRELEKVDGQAWTPSVGLLGFKDVAYSNLKVLKCSFSPAPSSFRSAYFPLPQGAHIDTNSDWSSLLEKCRSLEQIKIPVRHGDVYRWAYLEKKTALICAPILPTHRTKQLPPMHRIHLCGATVELLDTVADVAFAFQDTLQDLEAHAWLRVWQPATLEFDWTMARLTRLVLDGELSLHFCLDSLAWCPMLEHLSLSTDPSLDPGSHLLLYIRSREMHKVACLKRLRRLVLRGAWPMSDVSLRKIADRCRRLTSLVLDHTTETSIGGVLLAVERMYMLESLSLRLDVVDLYLVRVVVRKLDFLRSMQLTSLYKQAP